MRNEECGFDPIEYSLGCLLVLELGPRNIYIRRMLFLIIAVQHKPWQRGERQGQHLPQCRMIDVPASDGQARPSRSD